MKDINCINYNLYELYKFIWDNELKDDLCKLNATVSQEKRAYLPLFLQLGESYNKAELRIMYFGQEERPLKDKQGKFIELSEKTTLTELFDYYKKSNEKKNNSPKKQGSGGKMSAFIKKLFGNTTYTIHNNVLKIPSCKDIDANYGKPTDKIKYILENGHLKYPIILNEINIIQPDAIIIFPRGYYKNGYVEKFIGNFQPLKKEKFLEKYGDNDAVKKIEQQQNEFWKQLILGYFKKSENLKCIDDIPINIENIPVIIAKHPSHGHLAQIEKCIVRHKPNGE